MPYTLIDHTADMGVKISSPTIEMLFEEAAHALADILGATCTQGSEELLVQARGIDREDLLVRWLQEILYLVEVRGWRLNAATIEVLGETEVQGVLKGARVQGPLTAEVKAVTYHNLKIVHADDVFEVTIILDM